MRRDLGGEGLQVQYWPANAPQLEHTLPGRGPGCGGMPLRAKRLRMSAADGVELAGLEERGTASR